MFDITRDVAREKKSRKSQCGKRNDYIPFLGAIERIRVWMFIFDEDVFLAWRWSKRFITFRRLTLFYRQTMNRQAKLTHNVTHQSIDLLEMARKCFVYGAAFALLSTNRNSDTRKCVCFKGFEKKNQLFYSLNQTGKIFVKESNFMLECIQDYQK